MPKATLPTSYSACSKKKPDRSHAYLQKIDDKKYILEMHFRTTGLTNAPTVYRCYSCPHVDADAQIEIKTVLHYR
ncbi:MAG: hypothetical protein SPJ54_08440 [Candidatus Onthomorpha sp.]|nr:hypothetical protein [Candidatus Onthomorpha sp.]